MAGQRPDHVYACVRLGTHRPGRLPGSTARRRVTCPSSAPPGPQRRRSYEHAASRVVCARCGALPHAPDMTTGGRYIPSRYPPTDPDDRSPVSNASRRPHRPATGDTPCIRPERTPVSTDGSSPPESPPRALRADDTRRTVTVRSQPTGRRLRSEQPTSMQVTVRRYRDHRDGTAGNGASQRVYAPGLGGDAHAVARPPAVPHGHTPSEQGATAL